MTESPLSLHIRLRPALCGLGTTSKAAEQEMQARMRAGWERSGDDLGQPIHRATLQEAVAPMELAEAIHPEPYRTWTQAGLLLRLGHYPAAAEAYGSAGGAYARHAPAMVAQCLARVAGTHDPVAEDAKHVEAQLDRCEANGVDPAPLIAAQSRIEQLLAQAAQRPQPAPNATPEQEPPMGNPQLDRAAQTAQEFAELLADGDYAAAQQRLSESLRHITADDLRNEYEQMTMADEFPQDEPVEIVVMMVQDNMPNLEPGDLGWVHVAISGSEFNEAVTVVVTKDGGATGVCEIEWGWP